MTERAAARVASVRAFNRFYTNTIGVLRSGLAETPYSLTEARVLFELAQRETMEVIELRHSLDIDAGYLSRILTRFGRDGLAVRARSAGDGRRQVISLTDEGRAAFATLDQHQSADITRLLARISDGDQDRLLEAMNAIQGVLDSTSSRVDNPVLRSPEPGDLGWVVQRHGELYAREYGWDSSFEALVARVVSTYVDHHDPARESAWIADIGGRRAGSVFCVRGDEVTAKLRLLLVEPGARGTGIGTRLVDDCLRFARQAGYQRMTLWTVDALDAARRIYQRAGFELVDEQEQRSFGHDLVAQNWARDLMDG